MGRSDTGVPAPDDAPGLDPEMAEAPSIPPNRWVQCRPALPIRHQGPTRIAPWPQRERDDVPTTARTPKEGPVGNIFVHHHIEYPDCHLIVRRRHRNDGHTRKDGGRFAPMQRLFCRGRTGICASPPPCDYARENFHRARGILPNEGMPNR